jgi:hypothetical protein
MTVLHCVDGGRRASCGQHAGSGRKSCLLDEDSRGASAGVAGATYGSEVPAQGRSRE